MEAVHVSEGRRTDELAVLGTKAARPVMDAILHVDNDERCCREPAARTANAAEIPLLAEMSHELRSPMGAVVGLIDLALDEQLSPRARDRLETARESSRQVLELLEKSLHFFRIGSGRAELDPVFFSVRQMIDETVKSTHALAHKKGLELLSVIEPDVPDRLLGDPVRLRQVLVNLLSNAIKFTDDGEVRLLAALQTRGADCATLGFRVVDTGIGIPEEEQERIFLPFVRCNSSRNGHGTGLGLAITRRLVESMGGNIAVESRPGAGSEFHFRIPFRIPCGEQEAELEAGDAPTTRQGMVDSARPEPVLARIVSPRNGDKIGGLSSSGPK